MPTTALQVAEEGRRKEAEERARQLKEMQRLAQGALDESKKNNEIAQKGLKIARDSKKLSQCAIAIAIISALVSIILHFC